MLVPVSYTHLDVYKRQAVEDENSITSVIFVSGKRVNILPPGIIIINNWLVNNWVLKSLVLSYFVRYDGTVPAYAFDRKRFDA